MTLLAMLPDSSTTMIICHRSARRRTWEKNCGSSMNSRCRSASQCFRFRRMVACASKFFATRMEERRRRSRVPRNGCRTGLASFSISCCTHFLHQFPGQRQHLLIHQVLRMHGFQQGLTRLSTRRSTSGFVTISSS